MVLPAISVSAGPTMKRMYSLHRRSGRNTDCRQDRSVTTSVWGALPSEGDRCCAKANGGIFRDGSRRQVSACRRGANDCPLTVNITQFVGAKRERQVCATVAGNFTDDRGLVAHRSAPTGQSL